MGKYKYIIYNSYPNKIENEGEVWAFTLRLAYKKITKLANDKFFTVCRK
jgi:hypothetical protein